MKHTIENIKASGIKLTTQQGEFTRPSAAIIAAIELSNKGSEVNAKSIDEFAFSNFYFTLSGNKTRGVSKNPGDGRLYRRLDQYLNKYPQLFKYDRFSDELQFTDRGKAKLLTLKRERVKFTKIDSAKVDEYKIDFKSRKSILTKADKKKITAMSANHIK